MTLQTPLYMQPAAGDPAINYTAQQDRAGLLDAVFSREGILDVDAGQLRVAQRGAGANFSVDIAAGRAAMRGDDVSDQGTYLCSNTTVKNRTVPNPPSSGTRRHRVVARTRDKLHNGAWTVYDWEIQVLPDTGSGTPALPASAISLAIVTVAAGQSSVTNANIEDTRPRASVGTPERSGLVTVHPALRTDAARPYSWHVNPDGWVSLSGWAVQKTGVFTAQANTFYAFTEPLPLEVRPSTYRDFIIATTAGPVHAAVQADNGFRVSYRFITNTVINGEDQGAARTWFSLDGAGYKL